MKVITEESLKELYEAHKNHDTGSVEWTLKWLLRTELQEIDQLTVSKLRPMSEKSEICQDVLLKVVDRPTLLVGFRDYMDYFIIGDQYYKEDCIEGWIPIPLYKPEQS